MARHQRLREEDPVQDWSRGGSFLNKPTQGWLHPDDQLLPGAGVVYGVRYIGSMEVKQSMKTLDFDTRTNIAKESISRVGDAAGLTSAKKIKKSSRISKLLGDEPQMVYAGSNVNLSITTDGLVLTVMESGDIIGNHSMPMISFASGGDADTLDFVAFVAKDETFGRACHVLECGGGLAQDVITTIGQAFELRFKQYLAHKPEVTQFPSRLDEGPFQKDSWGEDNEYYNDRVGARPPSPGLPPSYELPSAAAPNDPSLSLLSTEEKKDPNLFQKRDEIGAVGGAPGGHAAGAVGGAAGAVGGADVANGDLDAFDMRPFASSLSPSRSNGSHTSTTSDSPYNENWFHGKISRQQCEDLLIHDGDFLVRESANSPGQFVLSGRQDGRVRHLLLVDPAGQVKTKDRTFQSVSHLIKFHVDNEFPIISQDTRILLAAPILKS